MCNANAETAHNLIHWKHDLLEWVDSNLTSYGFMTPQQLVIRSTMKPKSKYKLVDKIMADWSEMGQIKTLYAQFKSMIEAARNQSTSGRQRGGFR